MKKVLALVVVLLVIIGGVYAYTSNNNIQVSEDTKYSVGYDTKIVTLTNNSSHKKLVQLEVINDVKTSFGNYQPMTIEYKEVILSPGEKKEINIIQYHTRKVRWDIVKEVELKGE